MGGGSGGGQVRPGRELGRHAAGAGPLARGPVHEAEHPGGDGQRRRRALERGPEEEVRPSLAVPPLHGPRRPLQLGQGPGRGPRLLLRSEDVPVAGAHPGQGLGQGDPLERRLAEARPGLVTPRDPRVGEASVQRREQGRVRRRRHQHGALRAGALQLRAGVRDDEIGGLRRGRPHPSRLLEDLQGLGHEDARVPADGDRRRRPGLEREEAAVVGPERVRIGIGVPAYPAGAGGGKRDRRLGARRHGRRSPDPVVDDHPNRHPRRVPLRAARADRDVRSLTLERGEPAADQDVGERPVRRRPVLVGGPHDDRQRTCGSAARELERRPLQVGEQMDLALAELGPRQQRGGPLQRGRQVAGGGARLGPADRFPHLRGAARDGRKPRLPGPNEPEPVLVRGVLDRRERELLEPVQHAELADDQAGAHGVVEHDGDGRGRVRGAPAQEDQPGAGTHQQDEHEDAGEEEEKLPQADAAGVLLLRALQVAQRGKAQAARLMTLEEVQEDRHRHGDARQEEERVQRSHRTLLPCAGALGSAVIPGARAS